MVARWLSVLSTYDFVIEYRRGSVHTNADAMSRKLCRSCKNPECLDCKDKMSRSSKVLKTEDGLADKKDTKVSIAFQAAPVLNANQKDSHGHERQTETASLRAEHDELIDSKGTAMPVVDHINCVAHVDAENSAETRTHDSSSDFNDSNWVHTWTVDQIKHWQSQDECIDRIASQKSSYSNQPPTYIVAGDTKDVKRLWSLWDQLVVVDGLLRYKWLNCVDETWQILLVAPFELRKKLHCDKTAGHFGRRYTIEASILLAWNVIRY